MVDHDRGCFQMLTLKVVTIGVQEGRRNCSHLQADYNRLIDPYFKNKKTQSTQNKTQSQTSSREDYLKGLVSWSSVREETWQKPSIPEKEECVSENQNQPNQPTLANVFTSKQPQTPNPRQQRFLTIYLQGLALSASVRLWRPQNPLNALVWVQKQRQRFWSRTSVEVSRVALTCADEWQ